MDHPSILTIKQMERIEKILDELQAKTRCTYAFLADISGQLIGVRGRVGSTDIVELVALTASNMAATTEMARRIGEKNGFRLLFHEGEHDNIYLSHIGQSFLLAVVFSVNIQIGLVRLFSKRAVEELMNLVTEYEAAVSSVPSIMESDLGNALDQELDRLMPGEKLR